MEVIRIKWQRIRKLILSYSTEPLDLKFIPEDDSVIPMGNIIINTVEVMILSRYRYSVTVTHRRPPLRTVHRRNRKLPTVTDRYRILPLLALPALH